MLTFDVDGLTCGRCAQAVVKAVQALDPGAQVQVDLAAGTVLAETKAEPRAVAAAIQDAGYVVKTA